MRTLLILGLSLWLGGPAWAQLDLPRKSPRASIAYEIGLATIKIDYSSPAVAGRAVWGGMVPYGEVWRAGANEATTVEFSTDVIIEGKYLDKGRYALFFIPKKGDEWTAIFNKVADQWGAYRYDEKQDALRVPIKVKQADTVEERLHFSVTDQAPDRGYIRLGWEKMRAYILVRVDLPAQVAASVKDALAKAPADQHWLIHAQAGEFFLDMDLADKAKDHANRSLEGGAQCRNLWLRARVLAQGKDWPGAIAAAESALAAGEATPDDRFYTNNKERIAKELAAWKGRKG